MGLSLRQLICSVVAVGVAVGAHFALRGVFGHVYSRMWSVSDINFAMLSETNKKEIEILYGAVYAGMPADCWAQFFIASQQMDEVAFQRDILMPMQDDDGDVYRVENNTMVSGKASNLGNTRQQKYVIVSTNKPNIQQARERLRHVQRHLVSALSALGSVVREVGNNERLRVLHDFSGRVKNSFSILIWMSAAAWGMTSGMPFALTVWCSRQITSKSTTDTQRLFL